MLVKSAASQLQMGQKGLKRRQKPMAVSWIPHTDDDLSALRSHQLTAADPSARLQAQMRRGADGHIVCERCGGKVQYGWVYQFGAIVLATCGKPQCQPPPPWVQAVRFR